MDKLKGMRAFVCVADAEGFSNAARRTKFTKTQLSKYVAQLEEDLNVRLFNRTTRQISLTDIGRSYYDRCLILLDELNELDAEIRDTNTAPEGEIKLSASISFSELHLMEVVSKFTTFYPKIRIRMVLSDGVVNIVEEGFDIALRIGKLPDSDLIVRRLCTIHSVACASPQYLAQHGVPRTPRDLGAHHCIVDTNYKRGAQWLFFKGEEKYQVKIEGDFYVNGARAAKELALFGKGIFLSPTFVVGEGIKSNELTRVLSDFSLEPFGLYVVYSDRKYLSRKVRLFIDFLVESFKEVPTWD